MKYMKRKGVWQNSTDTLTFNPETMEARSYGWYKISLKVFGTVYVNSYNYSTTTSKHSYQLRSKLRELGIGY